jgi:hypothetical protein
MDRIWASFLSFSAASGIELSNDSKEKTVYTSARSAAVQPLRDRVGKAIPYLHPNEHYKYLGIYTSLDLSWNRQQQETERSLQRHVAFLRRSAFTGDQCVTILNRVTVPSILYRAQCVPFPTPFLRQCDAQMATLLRSKFKLPANAARGFLRKSKETNGYGLTCLEAAAPATLAQQTLSAGLNSWDTLTRATSAAMEAHHLERLRSSWLLPQQLSLVRNTATDRAAREHTLTYLKTETQERMPTLIAQRAPLLRNIIEVAATDAAAPPLTAAAEPPSRVPLYPWLRRLHTPAGHPGQLQSAR